MRTEQQIRERINKLIEEKQNLKSVGFFETISVVYRRQEIINEIKGLRFSIEKPPKEPITLYI